MNDKIMLHLCGVGSQPWPRRQEVGDFVIQTFCLWKIYEVVCDVENINLYAVRVSTIDGTAEAMRERWDTWTKPAEAEPIQQNLIADSGMAAVARKLKEEND
jgi:hypothetical protein